MHLRPGTHSHRPIAAVLTCVLGGGLRPGARILAIHLRPVTPRPASVGTRASEARIGVEAAPGPQTDEDLARTSLKPLLQLHGIVARIEDEQGDGFFSSEPTQQSL